MKTNINHHNINKNKVKVKTHNKNYINQKNNVDTKVKNVKQTKLLHKSNTRDQLNIISNKLVHFENKLITQQSEMNTQYDMFANINTTIANINKQMAIRPLENGIVYVNLEYANITLPCNYVMLGHSIMLWCAISLDKFKINSVNGLIEIKNNPFIIIAPNYYGTINIINKITNACYTGIISNTGDSVNASYVMTNRPLVPLGIDFDCILTIDLRLTNEFEPIAN